MEDHNYCLPFSSRFPYLVVASKSCSGCGSDELTDPNTIYVDVESNCTSDTSACLVKSDANNNAKHHLPRLKPILKKPPSDLCETECAAKKKSVTFSKTSPASSPDYTRKVSNDRFKRHYGKKKKKVYSTPENLKEKQKKMLQNGIEVRDSTNHHIAVSKTPDSVSSVAVSGESKLSEDQQSLDALERLYREAYSFVIKPDADQSRAEAKILETELRVQALCNTKSRVGLKKVRINILLFY